jgi:beta-lactamase class A
MPTASVIKLFILAALHDRAARGEVSLSDRITFEERHRTPGSGVLSYLDEGVEMSVRDAAMMMIGISDNSTSNMCLDAAGGVEGVNRWIAGQGFTATRLLGPVGDIRRGLDGRQHYVTTAAESAQLMHTIAMRECISPEASDDMLRILRRNQKREKLARHLPWNGLNFLPNPRHNWVAHKGGTYMDGRHDVALIHGPCGEVIVAAFTEGGRSMGDDHEGSILLADIGKMTWDALCGDGTLPSERDHIG